MRRRGACGDNEVEVHHDGGSVGQVVEPIAQIDDSHLGAPLGELFVPRVALEDDAGEVAQDSLISMARALPGFRGDAAVSTWLYTIALFVIWEAAVWIFQIPVFFLPPPTAIAYAIYEYWPAIYRNSLITLWATMIGFGLAVGFGLLLGLVVGWSRSIYAGLYPLMIGFNAIPKVAVVPILVLWFGIGFVPAVLTAFLISFFPIVVNVATGLATIEPELEDVLKALGASKLDIMRKVGIPRSMPYFFASLKVAVTLAFVGAIISETVAGKNGIGYASRALVARIARRQFLYLPPPCHPRLELPGTRHHVLDAAASPLHHAVDGAEDHSRLTLEITGHRLAVLVEDLRDHPARHQSAAVRDHAVRAEQVDRRSDVFAIGYYAEQDLPFTPHLAKAFTAYDRFFCSLLSSTYPNREYMYAGQSYGMMDNTIPVSPSASCTRSRNVPSINCETTSTSFTRKTTCPRPLGNTI